MTKRKGLLAASGAVVPGALLVLALALPAAAGQADDLATAKALSRAFASVAEKTTPAVVFVRVERDVAAGAPRGHTTPFNDPFEQFSDEFFRRFFGQRHYTPAPRRQERHYIERGQGTGFLVDPKGLILTNHHVVGEADRIFVKLHDGREFKAERVGSDPHTDVAVIRIKGENLPCLKLGDSDRLDVGDWVVAIGNPFGLMATVTTGIVSAKGRSRVGMSDLEDYIQTDAAINPGNSGGPLLDLDGNVVGINSAIYTRSGGYMGIGFAIPINLARTVEKQLVEHGKVERGYLGVTVQDLTPELAHSFGVEANRGALVASVQPRSPAEEAGLAVGDVVTEVNGTPIKGSNDLRNAIGLLAPGSKARLGLRRGRQEMQLVVEIGNADGAQAAATPKQSEAAGKLGLEVVPLTPEAARSHGLRYEAGAGVLIASVDPGSVASLSGLRPGQLITEVNRKPVKTPGEFHAELGKALAEGRVLLRVQDASGAWFVVLNLR